MSHSNFSQPVSARFTQNAPATRDMNQIIQQVPLRIEPEDTIDLPSSVDMLIDHRWLIAAVALAVTLLGIAVAYFAKPMYEATLLIQVEDRPFTKTDPLGDALSGPDSKAIAASEIEILKSRMVVSRAVDNLKLYIEVQPKYFPGIGEWIAGRTKQLSTPGLFGYGGWVWGAERARVPVFDVPEELEGKDFVLTALGTGRYRLEQREHGVSIEGSAGRHLTYRTPDGNIELLIDRLDANSGSQFRLTRQARVETIEKLQNALLISEKGKQSGIIGVALERPDPKLASAILNEIGQEYIRQNVERKSEEAEKSLAFLNKQLPDLKREMEASEQALNSLRNQRGTFDLAEEIKILLQQTASAQTKLVDTRQRREILSIRFEDAHPEMQVLDRQIQSFNGDLAALNAKIRKLPEIEQEVLRLNRDVKVNTELYTNLLRTAQELRLASASRVGNVRLLDNAMAPVKPVNPKRLIIILSAALAGIILGVMAVFMRKSLSRRIEDPHQIKQLLSLPVSATIPHSDTQRLMHEQIQNKEKKVSVLTLLEPGDNVVESLRGFRASLQFSMRDAENNIIVITGPTPGVGKSFVSANFASVLAASGKKVLLIDGDLRTGYLHRYFGLERGNGLADLVLGKVKLLEAVHKEVVENVDFIATGDLPQNPAELLDHARFGKLLESLSSCYDFVLIDTPPVLAVADALTVASHSGAIFNIVRGGVTTKNEIEESVKRMNQAGLIVTGVVFNDSRVKGTRYRYELGYGKYPQYA